MQGGTDAQLLVLEARSVFSIVLDLMDLSACSEQAPVLCCIAIKVASGLSV